MAGYLHLISSRFQRDLLIWKIKKAGSLSLARGFRYRHSAGCHCSGRDQQEVWTCLSGLLSRRVLDYSWHRVERPFSFYGSLATARTIVGGPPSGDVHRFAKTQWRPVRLSPESTNQHSRTTSGKCQEVPMRLKM